MSSFKKAPLTKVEEREKSCFDLNQTFEKPFTKKCSI